MRQYPMYTPQLLRKTEGVRALISQFMLGGYQYRLITYLKSGNKEPSWLLEKQEEDGLGDPRWVRDWDFAAPQHDAGSNRHYMLLRLIEQLTLLTDSKLHAAHKLGGWEAVSDILRDRIDKNEQLVKGDNG